MKRFILPLLLLLLMSPAFTQNIVNLSGTVTDSATGQPITNQTVYISSDSSGGFFYYNTVSTNASGYYLDSISLPPGVDTGFIFVSTYDCINSYVLYTLTFGPTNMNIVQNFQICTNAPSPCQANFNYYDAGVLTIQFTDLSTGTTGPWAWSFGDGTTSTLQNPTHTFPQEGYYPVSLTIGDSSTCLDMLTQTVHVIDSTGGGCVASFEAYPDSTGGYMVYFYDQSLGNINSWSWNFDDPASGMNNISTIQNPTHMFSQAGTYNVCLTIQGVDSSCYDTYCMPITVGNPAGGCEADFYFYSDSNAVSNTYHFIDISAGNINSWYWEFGDGTTSSSQNPTHTFATPGFYNVCLTVQGVDSLCYDTYCELVNVGGGAGCQAQFTYYPDSTSANNLFHFMDLSTGDINSWFWDFGDSTFSSEQNPSHMFPEEGTFYVCLTITGNNSGSICQSTWCEEVTVGTGSDCANYFSYQKNGLAVSFTGHMVNGQPATYNWDFGDGQSGQGQSAIHNYTASGIYFVSLTTVTQDPTACTYSTSQSIAVGDSTQWNQVYGQVFAGNFPLETGMAMIFSLDTSSAAFVPFIDISMIDSSGIYYFPMVPLGEYLIYAIPFTPTGYLPTYYGDVLNWASATVVTLGQANNPYNINLIEAYNFNTGNGGINGQINTGLRGSFVDKIIMLLMNETGEAISYSQVDPEGVFDFSDLDYGIYYLRAEMAGCESDIIKVTITAGNPVVDVVMTFNGNHILGVNENKQTMEAGEIYPNPVRDQAQISIKLTEGTQVYVELFNLSGQQVYQRTEYLNAGPATIAVPVGQLKEGLYTLRIYTDSGLNLSRKLLKAQ
ncbi:MAG: PKD domain-containing protein [Bacteroidales bacterium]|nr:PKD domain-containing protein [Bacteroidales bacterium]